MISFPTDPDLGDSFTFNRIRFTYDTDGWSTSGQPFLYVNENGAISFDGGATFGNSDQAASTRGNDESPLWQSYVREGGGTGMGANRVRLGWRTDAQGLQAQVDATVIGTLVRNISTPTHLNQQLTAPGSPPIYTCRAWVSFTGTGTVVIRGSGNVSSITDNGIGDYTINFTTPMPDANYAVVFGATGFTNHPQGVAAIRFGDTPQPSSVRITTGNTGGANSFGQLSDLATVCVAVFR